MSLPCEHQTHPLSPPWTSGVQTLRTKRKRGLGPRFSGPPGEGHWGERGGAGLDSWVLVVDGLDSRYFWVVGPERSEDLNTLS